MPIKCAKNVKYNLSVPYLTLAGAAGGAGAEVEVEVGVGPTVGPFMSFTNLLNMSR